MVKFSGIYPWLSGFINLERGLGGNAGEHFKLDRMETLAELAGRPEQCAPVIHTAGSKGKGSVSAMICSILEEAGYRPARYLSPHVRDWRERVCGGSNFFPEAIYESAGEELMELYDNYRSGYASAGGEPTFFELITLYFFLCARTWGADFMVIETGLGGRLDATNIVDPLVSVITGIELEHTEYLGTTLEAIAAEKGGIIKQGRPLVLAQQKPEVLAVLQSIALEKSAPVYYLPEQLSVEDLQISREGTAFLLRSSVQAGELSCTVPMTGSVQAYNAALAVLALQVAFLEGNLTPSVFGGQASPIPAGALQRGLAKARLPARFERVNCPLPFIVDGAHTPASISLCVESFCGLYGEGGILLFGCAAEKDVRAIAELLIPHFSRIIITTPGTFRASDPEGAYSAFLEAAGPASSVKLIRKTEDAIGAALDLAQAEKLPLLAAGSFYLASRVYAYFRQA